MTDSWRLWETGVLPVRRVASGRRSRLVFAVQVCLSVGLIVVLASRLSGEDLANLVHGVGADGAVTGVVLLAVAALGGVGSVIGASVRLQGVGRIAGLEVPLRTAVRVNCLSVLAAVLSPLGLAGDALRVYLLTRSPVGAEPRAGVRVAVADRLIGVATSTVAAVVGLALLGSVSVGGLVGPLRLLTAGIAGLLVIVFCVAAWRHRRTPAVGAPPWSAVMTRSVRDPVVLAGSIVSQTCEVLSALALVRLLGFDGPPAGLIVVISSFLPLIEAIPASFVGIGAREGVLEFSLLRFGAPTGAGLVLGASGLVLRLAVLGGLLLWSRRDTTTRLLPGRLASLSGRMES
jgi:uncharacterized membrane protein YbhN (UPF0104 family)